MCFFVNVTSGRLLDLVGKPRVYTASFARAVIQMIPMMEQEESSWNLPALWIGSEFQRIKNWF